MISNLISKESIAPLFHTAPVAKRKPGRPKGARGSVLQEARALGIHHFAFVRSSLLGLELADAFARYLAWSETTTDLRYVWVGRSPNAGQPKAGAHACAQKQPPGKSEFMSNMFDTFVPAVAQ